MAGPSVRRAQKPNIPLRTYLTSITCEAAMNMKDIAAWRPNLIPTQRVAPTAGKIDGGVADVARAAAAAILPAKLEKTTVAPTPEPPAAQGLVLLWPVDIA